MGMGIVVDVRDGDVEGAAVDGVFDWLRFVDERSRRTSRRARSAASSAASSRRPTPIRRSEPCSSAARSSARTRVDSSTPRRADGSIPPASSRAGQSTRQRPSSRREAPGASRSTRAATSSSGGDPEPGDRWHVGIRHPHRGPGGCRRRGERPRHRDIGRLCPRRPRARSAHGSAAHRSALRDDHRSGARDGRRVRRRPRLPWARERARRGRRSSTATRRCRSSPGTVLSDARLSRR